MVIWIYSRQWVENFSNVNSYILTNLRIRLWSSVMSSALEPKNILTFPLSMKLMKFSINDPESIKPLQDVGTQVVWKLAIVRPNAKEQIGSLINSFLRR